MPVRDGLTSTRARLPADAAPIRAWDFVQHLISTQRHRHPADDSTALHKRFDAGLVVRRSGVPFEPDTIVYPGEDVFFYRMPAPEPSVPYKIDILHRDEDILVVDKPPFLATMPRGKHITETVTVRLRRLLDLPELVPAHRLDRLTSGVLLFTLRKEVRGSYQRLFADRAVTKTYEAIAPLRDFTTPLDWSSHMIKTPGDIQGFITPGEPNAHTTLLVVQPVAPDEQVALTSVHGPLEPQGRYVLQPKTGRTHQLRLHMWAAGVPIIGDPVYPRIHTEAEEDFRVPMHLRASGLRFIDPLSGKERSFAAPSRLFPTMS
ncbi:Ribosomal large subunit pseudouridine synthase A [Corynebacterium atrinae]|nr:Ribosomal large subunit pseudouridine synthase A [Corynebacterium atrinae]